MIGLWVLEYSNDGNEWWPNEDMVWLAQSTDFPEYIENRLRELQEDGGFSKYRVKLYVRSNQSP